MPPKAPIIAAAAGLGITHTADLLVAEYVARGELKLVLEDFVMPGPPISLVYPSAGHQLAKVRVFSDFAADLLAALDCEFAPLGQGTSTRPATPRRLHCAPNPGETP